MPILDPNPYFTKLTDFEWGREDALVGYHSPDQRSVAYRRGYLTGLEMRLRTAMLANDESTFRSDQR